MKVVEIKQVRSTIRHPKVQLKTLESMGLGRIGKVKEHKLTPEIIGMIKKVSHLVEVREVK